MRAVFISAYMLLHERRLFTVGYYSSACKIELKIYGFIDNIMDDIVMVPFIALLLIQLSIRIQNQSLQRVRLTPLTPILSCNMRNPFHC